MLRWFQRRDARSRWPGGEPLNLHGFCKLESFCGLDLREKDSTHLSITHKITDNDFPSSEASEEGGVPPGMHLIRRSLMIPAGEWSAPSLPTSASPTTPRRKEIMLSFEIFGRRAPSYFPPYFYRVTSW